MKRIDIIDVKENIRKGKLVAYVGSRPWDDKNIYLKDCETGEIVQIGQIEEKEKEIT